MERTQKIAVAGQISQAHTALPTMAVVLLGIVALVPRVLGLVDFLTTDEVYNWISRVERFSDCIQCEQCVTSCPTTALVMHYQGTVAPPIRLPELDDYYQALPGLYLIGMPFLRRRKSTLIDGADADAAALTDHLAARLDAVVRGEVAAAG